MIILREKGFAGAPYVAPTATPMFTSSPAGTYTNQQMNKAMELGRNSTGVIGGLKNTWRSAGTLGKAGMVTAGVASAYLMGKGLFGGKKKDKN